MGEMREDLRALISGYMSFGHTCDTRVCPEMSDCELRITDAIVSRLELDEEKLEELIQSWVDDDQLVSAHSDWIAGQLAKAIAGADVIRIKNK